MPIDDYLPKFLRPPSTSKSVSSLLDPFFYTPNKEKNDLRRAIAEAAAHESIGGAAGDYVGVDELLAELLESQVIQRASDLPESPPMMIIPRDTDQYGNEVRRRGIGYSSEMPRDQNSLNNQIMDFALAREYTGPLTNPQQDFDSLATEVKRKSVERKDMLRALDEQQNRHLNPYTLNRDRIGGDR